MQPRTLDWFGGGSMAVSAQADRVTRSKHQAQVTYDRMSRWYDALAEGSEGELTEEGLQKLGLAPGEAALEVGCGTGHGLVTLARRVGPAGRVAGADLSRGMLRRSSETVDRAGLHGAVPLVLADAAYLPFASRSFDAVFMSYTLELIDTPEIPAVLSQCRRVLRPGGRLGVVALALRPGGPMATLYAWAHRHLPALADCRAIPVREMVQEAGFRVTDYAARAMWGMPVDIVVAVASSEARKEGGGSAPGPQGTTG